MTAVQTPGMATGMPLGRLAAAGLALGLAACGGAGEDTPAAAPGPSPRISALSRTGPAYVTVEGCVASGAFTPRRAAVGAVSFDGRLLGTSSTNEDGVFVLQLPTNTQVEISVLEPGGYSIELAVGTQPIVLTACLRVGGYSAASLSSRRPTSTASPDARSTRNSP